MKGSLERFPRLLWLILIEVKDPDPGLLFLTDVAGEELADLVLSRSRE
jgi:hypothetical protein